MYGFSALYRRRCQVHLTDCNLSCRWLQAKKAGKAPPVVLESTSEDALKTISLDELKEFAVKKSVS